MPKSLKTWKWKAEAFPALISYWNGIRYASEPGNPNINKMSWLLIALDFIGWAGFAVACSSDNWQELSMNKLINHIKHATETIARIDVALRIPTGGNREPSF
eukprot:3395091-Karenia_brevis.AAC.1